MTSEQQSFVGRAARTHNMGIEKFFLFGATVLNQTVVLLINFVGKRTVVLTSTTLSTSLNPSFKNFIYP